jgi:hypothetical protein
MGDVVGQAVTIKRGVDVAEKEGDAVVVGYAEITNKGVDVTVSVGESVFVGVGDETIADGVGVTVCEKAAPTKERMLSI